MTAAESLRLSMGGNRQASARKVILAPDGCKCRRPHCVVDASSDASGGSGPAFLRSAVASYFCGRYGAKSAVAATSNTNENECLRLFLRTQLITRYVPYMLARSSNITNCLNSFNDPQERRGFCSSKKKNCSSTAQEHGDGLAPRMANAAGHH